jgi:hypothetical protein
LAVDPLQQVEIDPVHLGHGLEAMARGMPDIGLGAGLDVGAGRGGRRQPVEGFGDT